MFSDVLLYVKFIDPSGTVDPKYDLWLVAIVICIRVDLSHCHHF